MRRFLWCVSLMFLVGFCVVGSAFCFDVGGWENVVNGIGGFYCAGLFATFAAGVASGRLNMSVGASPSASMTLVDHSSRYSSYRQLTGDQEPTK